MMNSRVKKLGLAAASGLLLAGGGGAVASLGGSASAASSNAAPLHLRLHVFRSPAAKLQPAEASLRHELSVFRDAAAQAPSAAIKQQLGFLTNAMTQVPSAQAVGVTSTAGATYVQLGQVEGVIIPGRSGVCMGAVLPFLGTLPSSASAPRRGGIVCGSTQWISDHGLGELSFSQDTQSEEVFGMVPDGNTTVAVTNANGSVTSVPVQSNFFFYSSTQPFQHVQFHGASGTLTTFGSSN